MSKSGYKGYGEELCGYDFNPGPLERFFKWIMRRFK